jgi:hypothetical protein
MGLPPLHVMFQAEAQVGIYKLTCTQQWRPRYTNFSHTKNYQDKEQDPILQMWSHRMLLRYAYHKTFTVKFPNKCEWQNRFNPDNKGGLAWYTDRSKTNTGTGAEIHRCGLRSGYSFSLGLHTTVFQDETNAINTCIMQNTEKG